MSAEHTKGTLEWEESAHEANRFTINIKGHHWLLSILHNGEQLIERQRANMRRMVACWNACDGIDTEMLEGLSPRFLATYPDRVLAERRALEAQIAIQANPNDPRAHRKALSAIAKATGV